MSVYDVIAVLYTKHMKFLWLRYKLDTFRKSLVFLFPKENERFSIIGSGDFALPLLFTITTAKINLQAGFIAAIFSTIGFSFSVLTLKSQ